MYDLKKLEKMDKIELQKLWETQELLRKSEGASSEIEKEYASFFQYIGEIASRITEIEELLKSVNNKSNYK